MKKFGVLILFLIGLNPLLSGEIHSQWRGPNRDGVYPGERLLRTWPASGPELLWRADGLGRGYSSAAVTPNRVYVTGERDGEGFLYAFDRDGKRLWASSYGQEWDGSRPGARTTPTVAGDLIYLMSAEAAVVCFDTKGNKVWSVDLEQTFGARNLQWGITESPLVDGDRVICTPGGGEALVAAGAANGCPDGVSRRLYDSSSV